MKNKLSILLLFFCLNIFGQGGTVPDNVTFSFNTVWDVIYGDHNAGRNMVQTFTDSDADLFDATYGSKTMSPQTLLGFRNYGPKLTAWDDWYLPSRTELPLMYDYLYLYNVGDFSPSSYWSSTEVPEVPLPKTKAYGWHFGLGLEGELLKVNSYRVRAMRMFTLPTNSYALRDEGPAGGLIFYKEVLSGDPDPSIMYYEAAPSDQSSGTYWTNAITICNNLVIYH